MDKNLSQPRLLSFKSLPKYSFWHLLILAGVQPIVVWVGRGDAESFLHVFYYLLAWISPFIVHKPSSLFTFYKLHVLTPPAGLATVIGSSHRAGLTGLHLCWCLPFSSWYALYAFLLLLSVFWKESEERTATMFSFQMLWWYLFTAWQRPYVLWFGEESQGFGSVVLKFQCV